MDAKRTEMALLSNSIAAYAHIKDNPESFGLYFVIGVCFGLVLTLCLLVVRISCKPRTRTPSSPTPEKKKLKDLSEETEDDDSDEEEVEEEEEEEETRMVRPMDRDVEMALPLTLPTTEIPPPSSSNHTSHTGGCSDGTLSVNVFTSAEELERAQRLEERERIIREIWRNGQPDILGSGTGTLGRVHYY
ncbi:eva-1 homolog Ba [Engraulis encrasicolus]|uniref:eva-1 homolog Ba n=1 Tax=Engraulis encrasicolus TaxID=184585 RepID=UPI002FD6419B